MNAFEVLGISPGASEKEIKKAYFNAVRKCPPDKDPEKFKEIRTAYETLCDSEKREKAEKLSHVSPEVRKLIEAAEKALSIDNNGEAMACLDAAIRIDPENITVIDLIGNVHMANGSFGLAVKHYEKYFAKYPGNLLFSSKLAVAYWQRGWNKKAKEQFVFSFHKGYLVPDFIEEFADFCYSEKEFPLLEGTFFDVAERCSGKEGTAAAAMCLSRLFMNASRMRYYCLMSSFGTDWVKDYLIRKPEFQTIDFFTELFDLLLDDMDEDIYKRTRGLVDLAVTLVPEAVRDFTFGRARYMLELSAMDEDYDSKNSKDKRDEAVMMYAMAVYSLEYETRKSYDDFYPADKTFDVFNAQMNLIDVSLKRMPNFRQVIEKYPYIWSFMDEFVTKLQGATNLKKFSDRHIVSFFRSASPDLKQILKEKLPHEAYEYYQYLSGASAPVRSEKIPPNAPCPCGSGKKCKKCCGR